ncbi:uncharacterized protein BDR25DRAFT_360967 [Lindgomyces ingoldianus]|uniref:Uncharacterized protein n=1 Tax=Lindgomyces ingoldianus TaxID=673940 RepID=A0ACB6QDM9_9PLEO|nr:uncharacterized protein BDR25DRAFT_360967 [Lindgomyces ingoldianus]KAF2465063.1 hypothetical protein BDR25DRAFT_360967 [Lindgomyces ingoldianus]
MTEHAGMKEGFKSSNGLTLSYPDSCPPPYTRNQDSTRISRMAVAKDTVRARRKRRASHMTGIGIGRHTGKVVKVGEEGASVGGERIRSVTRGFYEQGISGGEDERAFRYSHERGTLKRDLPRVREHDGGVGGVPIIIYLGVAPDLIHIKRAARAVKAVTVRVVFGRQLMISERKSRLTKESYVSLPRHTFTASHILEITGATITTGKGRNWAKSRMLALRCINFSSEENEGYTTGYAVLQNNSPKRGGLCASALPKVTFDSITTAWGTVIRMVYPGPSRVRCRKWEMKRLYDRTRVGYRKIVCHARKAETGIDVLVWKAEFKVLYAIEIRPIPPRRLSSLHS